MTIWSPLWGRAIFGCDFIARPRRSAAATPSSSLFVSLENRLGQMVTVFLAGPLAAGAEAPRLPLVRTLKLGRQLRDFFLKHRFEMSGKRGSKDVGHEWRYARCPRAEP